MDNALMCMVPNEVTLQKLAIFIVLSRKESSRAFIFYHPGNVPQANLAKLGYYHNLFMWLGQGSGQACHGMVNSFKYNVWLSADWLVWSPISTYLLEPLLE